MRSSDIYFAPVDRANRDCKLIFTTHMYTLLALRMYACVDGLTIFLETHYIIVPCDNPDRSTCTYRCGRVLVYLT